MDPFSSIPVIHRCQLRGFWYLLGRPLDFLDMVSSPEEERHPVARTLCSGSCGTIDHHLRHQLQHLQALGVAPSTQRTYRAGVHHYERFFTLYDLPPWPASDLTLQYYCVHAYKTLSHATILVYLAGFRHQHLQLGHSNPLTNRPLLAYLCKGIKCHLGTAGRVRLPLSATQLADLNKAIQQATDHLSQDKMAICAALSLAFHTFLRAAEFTIPTTNRYSPT